MADYLVKRGSFWRFVRRVPKEYADLDKRVIVQHSTKIRVADDPKAIRASRKAHEFNGNLERYWHDLANGDLAKAVHDYEAALKAAKRMQLSAPIDDSAKRTIGELLERIEKLETVLRDRNVNDVDKRAAVFAAYDLAAKPDITFKQCAEKYIEDHRAGWKNTKHAAQWLTTLATYAYPVIGDTAVKQIGGNGGGTDLIMKILKPIWYDKTATASRVRGRIEKVLDWAKAQGYRDGENPARWKGHLEQLLPAMNKVAPTKHHAAMPYAEVPAFLQKLRAITGNAPANRGSTATTAARALELTILTACRTSDALGARRDEIDLIKRMWVIPAQRMKSSKEHRIPLSDAAIKIIKGMPEGDYLFGGIKKGKPLSGKALRNCLQRIGINQTVHGFRSAFRDWASETTNYPNEILEMALAHDIGNKVEAAYRRGDMLEKRHALMADWGRFCNSGS